MFTRQIELKALKGTSGFQQLAVKIESPTLCDTKANLIEIQRKIDNPMVIESPTNQIGQKIL